MTDPNPKTQEPEDSFEEFTNDHCNTTHMTTHMPFSPAAQSNQPAIGTINPPTSWEPGKSHQINHDDTENPSYGMG